MITFKMTFRASLMLGVSAILFGAVAAHAAEEVLPKTPAPFAGKIEADRDQS